MGYSNAMDSYFIKGFIAWSYGLNDVVFADVADA